MKEERRKMRDERRKKKEERRKKKEERRKKKEKSRKMKAGRQQALHFYDITRYSGKCVKQKMWVSAGISN